MVKPYGQKTIATTATKAAEYNAKRKSAGIANMDSSNRLYLGYDNQVTTDNGFPIEPQSILYLNEGLGDSPQLEIWLIAATAPIDARILEQYGGVE